MQNAKIKPLFSIIKVLTFFDGIRKDSAFCAPKKKNCAQRIC